MSPHRRLFFLYGELYIQSTFSPHRRVYVSSFKFLKPHITSTCKLLELKLLQL